MVFSSVTFLFLFLPISLLVYFCVPKSLRNVTLLTFSLLFYFWGTGQLFFVILLSIIVDYVLGLMQGKARSQTFKKYCLICSLFVNLGLLAYFKYYNFFIENINEIITLTGLSPLTSLDLILPLGISFYTFQTLSYQIDVYRGQVEPQKSFVDFALFVSLFPQLIAGPIVRYKDIATQLKLRKESWDDFHYGIFRFICGLAKKVILADGLAPVVDKVFSQDPTTLSSPVALIGASAFLLQIYYDFSGYSDMAIGLSRMFGFRIPENFRYPYSARTVTAFWQRWHITMTTWFRDYLYRPLVEGSRSRIRAGIGVYSVFFLCGLWHGANWTFVCFGLYFGTLLVLERFTWKYWGVYFPTVVSHLYLLIALLIGIVFFRSPDIHHAMHYLSSIFNFGVVGDGLYLAEILNQEFVVLFLLGAIFSFPVFPVLKNSLDSFQEMQCFQDKPYLQSVVHVLTVVVIPTILSAGLLILGVAGASSQIYNPFIYFQF